MTYNELKATYLTSLSDKAALTARAYKTALDSLSAFLGERADLPAEKITSATLLEFRAALVAEGVSVNAYADYLNKIKIFFAFCVRHGFLAESPIEAADLPKKQKIEYDLLSREQIEQTLTAEPGRVPKMHEQNRARNRAIVMVLLCCGLRNSELRALRLSDLDFENGTIAVQNGKGGKSRSVPFPAVARQAVEEYLQDRSRPPYLTRTALLFGSACDTRGHKKEGLWREMSAAGLEGIVKAYFGATAGKEGLKVHSLRHSAASLWDDLGVPMRDVQNALGHASVSTTERVYVQVLNRNKSAAKINAAFEAV